MIKMTDVHTWLWHRSCSYTCKARIRVPRRLENLEILKNENGRGKVMERENLQKVIEFCDQSWNFTDFVTSFDEICRPTFFPMTSGNIASV